MTDFEKNYSYFESIRDELVKNFHGKIVVISNEKEQKLFDDETEARNFAIKKFGYGNYIIPSCISAEENTSYIYSAFSAEND
jgi:hypothetical protein